MIGVTFTGICYLSHRSHYYSLTMPSSVLPPEEQSLLCSGIFSIYFMDSRHASRVRGYTIKYILVPEHFLEVFTNVTQFCPLPQPLNLWPARKIQCCCLMARAKETKEMVPPACSRLREKMILWLYIVVCQEFNGRSTLRACLHHKICIGEHVLACIL